MAREPKEKRYEDGCLVLKRKLGEKILVGDNIEIVVSEISQLGLWVKIGVNAPKEMEIVREELKTRNQES